MTSRSPRNRPGASSAGPVPRSVLPRSGARADRPTDAAPRGREVGRGGLARWWLRGAAAASAAAILGAFSGCGLSVSGVGTPAEGSPCGTASQCPDDQNPCTVAVCTAESVCVYESAPDGDAPEQVAGDCQRATCAAGVPTPVEDPGDVEDDHEDCTADTCVGGEPLHTARPEGSSCTVGALTGSCDAFATCQIGCTQQTADTDCDDGNFCTTAECDLASSTCVFTNLDGVPLPDADQVTGDCRIRICVNGVDIDAAMGGAVDDTDIAQQVNGDCKTATCTAGTPGSDITDTDVPIDNNECTTDDCNAGTPGHTNLVEGAPCQGTLHCNANAVCVGCTDPPGQPSPQCGASDDCKTFMCTNEVCGVTYTGPNVPVSQQTAGDCKVTVCDGTGGQVVAADGADLPMDDGNQCTSESCTGSTPQHPPLAAGTGCNQSGGQVCNGLANPTCVECLSNAECTAPETCGGGAPGQQVANVCGCTPANAAACIGKACGPAVNNCGATITCPNTCVAPQTCGGGGAGPNGCGCTADTLATTCAGKACGPATNNCGTAVTCPNTCVAPQTCGGGGAGANQCGCTADPVATTCAGKACGPATNNCGTVITCPNTCVAPQTCGGGGAGANGCGCTTEPVATTCAGKACGPATTNCGASITCPNTCVAPQTCGGGGAGANQCGCAADPMATTCSGKCGNVLNNCGTLVNCGNPCTAGTETCFMSTCCNPAGNPCNGKCGSVTIPDCGGTIDCGGCTMPQTCGGGGTPNVCGP